MKKIALSLLGLLVLINFSSAQWGNKSSISGNGVVKKENRNLGDFNEVTVASGIDVYIHYGDGPKVEVEADENAVAAILTEINGNTLKIYSKNSFRNVKKMRVNVWMNDVKGISASGGSDVYSVGTIKSDRLRLRGSGGSDIELDLDVAHLECSVSGGSDAELEGRAGECELQASGGSDIKAYGMKAGICSVSASGGSDAYVTVMEKIDLSASGGSDVHYKGDAKVGRMSVTGSSDVHH